MSRRIAKSAPYTVDVDGHKFYLRPSELVVCRVSKPKHGIVEFSIDGLRDLEWYEAESFDQEQFDTFLEEVLGQLIKVYALEDDARLSFNARKLKSRLLDMFVEGDAAA